MRRHFRFSIFDSRFCAALACLLLAGNFGRTETASKIETRDSKISPPLVWKITGPKTTSWLVGTIHLPRPEFANLRPEIAEAARQADAIYTEIPMDMGTMLGLAPAMLLPDGQTLGDVLPPEMITDLETELAAINPEFTLAPFQRFKPWALAASLMLLEDQMKFPGSMAMDTVIFQRGAMAGKEVGGIETPEEQLGLFDALSTEDQITMLRDTLREMRAMREDGESATDSLARLYRQGDLAALTAEINRWTALSEDPELTAQFMEKLLYHRNEIMADRIAEKLRAHPETAYLFAIGAGHLDGDRGVLALLAKDGFTLERLR